MQWPEITPESLLQLYNTIVLMLALLVVMLACMAPLVALFTWWWEQRHRKTVECLRPET